jgi:tetratricopeptide (TPR) repeat protein
MPDKVLKNNRNYGYDILCNNFEYSLRIYIRDVLHSHYGNAWIEHIPEGVINDLKSYKDLPDEFDIDYFFDELNFLHLKSIIINKSNYKLVKPFVGDLSKDKFDEVMNRLNICRRKIGHVKTAFYELDLIQLLDDVKLLCQGERAQNILKYINNEEYKNADELPESFFEDFECQNNLPFEDYDLVGGFVGRQKEINTIKKMINSEQDRIITITGAGGIGKTAIALKIAYSFLLDVNNPFEAIIWFTAKKDRLTEDGIVAVVPDIKDGKKLMSDIIRIINPDLMTEFEKASVPTESLQIYLEDVFSSNKCLLIIDNLETIINHNEIITFIKDVPRPSQVLITSRKGLGEIERRYPLPDMNEKDAITLFRLVAKERQRNDLLKLPNETIGELASRVRYYPLLIKWSIGQVILGKSIAEAFSEILAGDSEIAKFTFNDVFSLLSNNAKRILYSMVIHGEEATSKTILQHLANITNDEFEDAIKELIVTSFVFSEIRDSKESGLTTEYSMLKLTRGFIESKLDENNSIKQELLTRQYHLTQQLTDYEKVKSGYNQSLFSLGIKTPEEKIAFTYVKTAKNYIRSHDLKEAEENFEKALEIAPNSSYVLVEYSKFEFSRQHIPTALKFAKIAVECDNDNFHPWFNYGLIFQKDKHYDEALKCLIKANSLNPNHLPIYTEIARTLSFTGRYEEAESYFKDALKEEKYPNYKHQAIALQSMAENYRRWAQHFGRRRDYEGQIEKLQQAAKTIKEALVSSKKDHRLWKTFREINKDLGIALTHKEGFTIGKPYLEKTLETVEFDNFQDFPSTTIIAFSCYFLAKFHMNENDFNVETVKDLINRGLKNCKYDSELGDKLQTLNKKIEKMIKMAGTILFFDMKRKFGLIKSCDETYIFFKASFVEWMSQEELMILEGKEVNFTPVKNEKNGKFSATQIYLK